MERERQARQQFLASSPRAEDFRLLRFSARPLASARCAAQIISEGEGFEKRRFSFSSRTFLIQAVVETAAQFVFYALARAFRAGAIVRHFARSFFAVLNKL